jgi:DNA-binding transcriptional regulator YhcF (GntR family)
MNMNTKNEVQSFTNLQKLITLFQRVNQLSWTADQTRKRYPSPSEMTEEEIDGLARVFLALGYDIEEIYKEWKKIYDEYKKNTP